MSIGYILQKKQLRGSCGGLEQQGIERACECESVCEEHRLYQIQEPGTGGLDQ
ncbi:MAG: (Na+)-NQR maturation NqrM [Moritella sp.]|uniref:(Na+)-NQR maturation NqrM n=1 Tax=Moritella sp. TaxID=78556 RepID=UPI001DA19975|nr:(Na+)-NQR maturation NqrM [Moritella sp.]NQZ50646.1 (Na+)-NQR maturation NqrM [Moritella sp.]